MIILDNLSYGHSEAVKDFRLEKIDLVLEKENFTNYSSANDSMLLFIWLRLSKWENHLKIHQNIITIMLRDF